MLNFERRGTQANVSLRTTWLSYRERLDLPVTRSPRGGARRAAAWRFEAVLAFRQPDVLLA